MLKFTVMHYFTFIMGNANSDKHDVSLTQDLKSEILALKESLEASGSSNQKLLYFEHYIDPAKAIMRNLELRDQSPDELRQLVKEANPDEEDLSLFF